MDAAYESFELVPHRPEHRDRLLNQRLSWILNSQALLLAVCANPLDGPRLVIFA